MKLGLTVPQRFICHADAIDRFIVNGAVVRDGGRYTEARTDRTVQRQASASNGRNATHAAAINFSSDLNVYGVAGSSQLGGIS